MSNSTKTTASASKTIAGLATAWVAAEVAEHTTDTARKTTRVVDIFTSYKDRGISLRDLAEAINAKAALSSTLDTDRREVRHTTLALYVATGELIERMGRAINAATVAATFRYIARNPGKGVIDEVVSARPIIGTDAAYAAYIGEAYAALAASKAASKAGAASESTGKGDVKSTTAEPADDDTSAAVPASADVIVATLEAALTGHYSDDENERISAALDALQTYLGTLASALVAA